MSQIRGLSEMTILLQSFKESEGNETIEILKKLAEHLRRDINMKEHFHELNGTIIILKFGINASFSILNCVFDVLAAAVEDHEGNRMKLTIDQTFILINKVLASTDSLGLTASLRSLVLLSYVCENNVHAQDLANSEGCVMELEKMFLKFSRDMCSKDEKDDKLVFTWNILCTAIATVCGEPPNEKIQDGLRSVVRESANFLCDWTEKLQVKLQDVTCVKNMLIMLPYVLCCNRTNQDFFARSGGVHTIIHGLIYLKNHEDIDGNMAEVNIKLVYLLSVSSEENSEISKLAGHLGVIPILIKLLKQFNKEGKEIVLLCLGNLLNCPENEQIFLHLDNFTILTSAMKGFAKGSKAWNLSEKLCNLFKIRQNSKAHGDLSPYFNSSLHKEKKENLDKFHKSEKLPWHLDSANYSKASLFSRYKQDDERSKEDHTIDEELHFNSERDFNNKFQSKHHYRYSDYAKHDEQKRRSDFVELMPYYYERGSSINSDESLQDNYRIKQYGRMKMLQEPQKTLHNRYEDNEKDMQNRFHKSYNAGFTTSQREYSKKEMHLTSDYDDRYFLKSESSHGKQFLKARGSSSDLINRARQLYPRNKMNELEEMDIHQKRHYLTLLRQNFNYDEADEDQGRMFGGRYSRENFNTKNNLREEEYDFRENDMRKEWHRISQERHDRSYYNVDIDERRVPLKGSNGRQSRIDSSRRDRTSEYPQISANQYMRSDSDDEYIKEPMRKSIGAFVEKNYDTEGESMKQYLRKPLKNYTRDQELGKKHERMFQRHYGDNERQQEHERVSRQRYSKDDYSVNMESWKYNSQKLTGAKSFQALRRSRSMHRLDDHEMQTRFKDMELARDKVNDKKVSHNSYDHRNLNDSRQRSKSPTMPKLMSKREAFQNHISSETSLQKSNPNLSPSVGNTQLATSFPNENQEETNDHRSSPSATRERAASQMKNEHTTNETEPNKQSEKSEPAFSEEEKNHLLQGIQKYGLDFKAIFQEYKFHEIRTPHDLYQKWKQTYNL